VNTQAQEANARVEEKVLLIKGLEEEISKVLVGQRDLLDRLLIGLLADGHILVEGVPGLAKTTAVKTLAAAISTTFQRIQFTPDLLPADLIGTRIYLPKTGDFTTRKGPLFANIILADEINRAPAKVQSALLEAMQERQVTIGEETFTLPRPFLVMATQNPIEQEGTYPLPEAQVDRFMLKITITYPSREEEREIVKRFAGRPEQTVHPVLSPEEILDLKEATTKIYLDERLSDYIVDLVQATRTPEDHGLALGSMIQYGASPRASIYLNLAARAHAFLRGRGYATPEDIKSVAHDVLRHRVILSYEAEAEEITSDDVIRQILDKVEVP